MRFPSLALLAEHAVAVLRRFPWTLGAGTVAAGAAIVASISGTEDVWARLSFVAALGLPVTVAVTLLAETSGLSIPHTVNCLAGRKPVPPSLFVAMIKLGLVERAEARARSLLAALEAHR